MTFRLKLAEAARKNKSWLCIGLDPDPSKLPTGLGSGPEAVLAFNRAVIDSTFDCVCAYKPNAAFYESMGSPGWEVLEETIRAIPGHIPVIVDAKRGDIGNTATMYARSIFERLGADAVTVNPYLGRDSVEPFAKYVDKGIFILCLTSNRSSSDLQKQLILLEDPPEANFMTPQSKAKTFAEFFGSSVKKTYEYIAGLAVEWNNNNNLGLVVGATAPDELGDIRRIVGDDIPLLIPGVGAQGGDLEKSVEHGSDGSGEWAIINISRGIIYSWTGEGDYREQVRKTTLSFRERISKAVEKKAAKPN